MSERVWVGVAEEDDEFIFDGQRSHSHINEDYLRGRTIEYAEWINGDLVLILEEINKNERR